MLLMQIRGKVGAVKFEGEWLLGSVSELLDLQQICFNPAAGSLGIVKCLA